MERKLVQARILICISALKIVLVIANASVETCEFGFSPYEIASPELNNTVCSRIFTEKLSWDGAQGICRTTFSHLASKVNAAMLSILESSGIDYIWLGIKRRAGFFVTEYPAELFRERTKSTSDDIGPQWLELDRTHECVAFNVPSKAISTHVCSEKLSFVCDHGRVSKDIPQDFVCPSDWILSTHLSTSGRRCVRLFQPQKYNMAKLACRKSRSRLATLKEYSVLDTDDGYIPPRMSGIVSGFWTAENRQASCESNVFFGSDTGASHFDFRNCSTSLPFVCVKDFYHNDLEVWISPETIDSYTTDASCSTIPDLFTCNVKANGKLISGRERNLMYQWYKDGIPIPASAYVFRMSFFANPLKRDPSTSSEGKDGRYHCEVRLAGSVTTYTSDILDFYHPDVATYTINILKSRSDSVVDYSQQEFSKFWESQYGSVTENFMTKLRYWYPRTSWDFLNMTWNGSSSSVKLVLHIPRSSPNYASDKDVYVHLKKLVEENSHLFASGGKNASLSVFSADVCFAEDAIINEACHVRFQWPTSKVSESFNPNPLCLDNNWELVKRRCRGGEDKAEWEAFNCSDCTKIQQAVPDLQFECSDGYSKFVDQDLCYKIHGKGQAWEIAYETCAEDSAYLLTEITDDVALLGSIWMPLRYSHGKIQWIRIKPRSEKLLLDITNRTVLEHHCVAAILVGRDYIMKLENCDKNLPFVCVKNPYEILTSTKFSTVWTKLYNCSPCFYFGNYNYTWSDASSVCKDMPFGAHLLDGIRDVLSYQHFKMVMQQTLGDRKEEDCHFNSWWMNLVERDKSNLQFVDWSPYTSFKSKYSAGILVRFPPNEVSWSLDVVSRKHKFICEIKNCVEMRPAQVYIEDRSETVGAVPKTLSTAVSTFKLKCIFSGWRLRNGIQWYKDGILLNVMTEEFAFPLSLPSLEEVLKYQGYYWCSVISVKPSDGSCSAPVLFRLPGYHTYILSIKSWHEDYFSDCKAYMLSEMVSTDYGNFIKKCAMDSLKKQLSFIQLEIRNISCSKEGVNIIVQLHFKVEDGPEDAILHIIQNADFQSFAATCNIELSSISVRSTVTCSRQKIATGQGFIVWPSTPIGQIAYTEELCVTENGAFLSRKCIGDFNSGAVWEPPPPSNCQNKNSVITKQLYDLLQEKSYGLSQLNSTLLRLTSEPGALIPADVQITALILSSLAKGSSQFPDNLNVIIDTLDNLIEVPVEVIQKAANASSQLKDSLETAASSIQVRNGGFERYGINVGVHISPLAMSPSREIPNCAIFRTTDIRILVNATSRDLWSHSNSSKAGIMLPANVLSEKRSMGLDRMVYIIHRNLDYSESVQVLSSVVQASVGESALYDVEPPIEMYFQLLKDVPRNSSVRCSFWDQRLNGNFGGWSYKGCFTKLLGSKFVNCYCNHLTSFAVILEMHPTPNLLQHRVALNIITYVGCSLSCFGLWMIILTFIFFREWRKSTKNKALFNLSSSLMSFLILFMVGIDQTAVRVWCTIISAMLHYLLMSSFAWMLVSAFMMYLSLVKVLPTYIPCLMQKAVAFAWGIPAMIVITILAFDYNLYYSKQHCWLSTDVFYYAVVIPVLSMLMANFVIFGLILYANTCGKSNAYLRSNQNRRKVAIAKAKALFCISVLLGLSWIFGFLAIGKAKVVFQYLFALTTTSQGFFIFLFFIVRQRSARDLWITCIFPSTPQEKSRTYNTGTITSHKIHYTAEMGS